MHHQQAILKTSDGFPLQVARNLCVVLCALLLLAGCDQVETPFVFSPQTQDLLPAAEAKVKETLLETFGSPQKPQIPYYFPVNRGGTVLTVADFDPAMPGQLTIEPVEDPAFPASAPAEFLFDPEAALDVQLAAIEEDQPNPLDALKGLRIANFSAETQILAFNQPLPDLELIEPGAELAVEPNSRLQKASVLYAQHCLHCHGVSGDGNGPTAPFMEPPPRDYRLGIFKFTSTGPQEKISTADLKQILQEGIPGTYMPSFNMLPDEHLDLMVEYVKFLAIRGETEKNLNIEVGLDFSKKVLADELEGVEDPAERQEIAEGIEADLQEFLKLDYPEIKTGVLLDLSDAWAAADEEDSVLFPSIPRPDPFGPSPANSLLSSIENGRLLYVGVDAQCASCHGDTGKGNGFQTFQFQKKPDGSEYDVVGLHDTWGNPLDPRDLTTGIFRGGRRPIDLFRRIYGGIKGTPMPVFGGKGLTDAQIWDIVNYVLVLPQEEGK